MNTGLGGSDAVFFTALQFYSSMANFSSAGAFFASKQAKELPRR
jgi:hypothetical protein